MLIKSIKYKNFRNFKDEGKLYFSTDGKVNIIYGKNGDGKTTLHQLFHWIFYGEVHFNKTTTDKMYNLHFENELDYGKVFDVQGEVDFEHKGNDYSLRRVWTYRKEASESRKTKEELYLNKKTYEADWVRVESPDVLIEEFLPSSLSQYFFFDGESMIADLKVRGDVSADRLKEAFYSLFNLSVYEQAVDRIGSKELTTTAIGMLNSRKANIKSSDEVKQLRRRMEELEKSISDYEERQSEIQCEKKNLEKYINELSEKIGAIKSTQEYERQRKYMISSRDINLENIKKEQANYGEYVARIVPKLLLAKRIESAKNLIRLKIDESILMPGVSKLLVDNLLVAENCICGAKITEASKTFLEDILKLLPPLSYKEAYDLFIRSTESVASEFSKETLKKYIFDILTEQENAEKCDREIKNIDEFLKKSENVEKHIIERQNAESKVKDIEDQIYEIGSTLTKYKGVQKNRSADYDKATENTFNNKEINKKIEFLEQVKKYFEEKLEDASENLSEKLKNEIQILLNKMLNSRRTVSISKDFHIKVFDSFNDESKSEGQFAIVSFAYIAGILKLLEEMGKKYPLVLDGPFAKLSLEHKMNVIQTIPDYAKQIIIFSKESLQEYFPQNIVGAIWTIKSNEEKNIAKVEEGYKW